MSVPHMCHPISHVCSLASLLQNVTVNKYHADCRPCTLTLTLLFIPKKHNILKRSTDLQTTFSFIPSSILTATTIGMLTSDISTTLVYWAP